MITLILLILVYSPLTFAESEVLYRSPTKNVNIRALELDLNYSVFTSSGTFDENGNSTTFEADDSYSIKEFNFLSRYGFSRTVEFRAGIRHRSINSTSNAEELSNAGLESYLVGMRYSKNPYSKFSYALDASFRSSFYSNPEESSTGELILGDAGNEIIFGAHGSLRFASQNHLTGFLGYAIEPEDQSNEIIYNLEYAVPYKKWAYAFGFEGIKSMNGDTYSEAPENKPNLNTGSSQYFNSINREKFEPYFSLSHAFKGWRFGAKVSRVTAGVSTDEGTRFVISAVRVGTGKSLDDYKIERFKTYDIEATVTKVSPRGKFVKIDIGLAGGVEKGMRFDIYVKDIEGEQILVATGTAYETGRDWSIIKVVKTFRNLRLKKGFLARGTLN
ncbi:MAG: hypothetical protein ACO20H_03640 [Bacteriovoracaceae bacterium]